MKSILENNLNNKTKTCPSLNLNKNCTTIGVMTCSANFVLIGNIFVDEYCMIRCLSTTLPLPASFEKRIMKHGSKWNTCEQIDA